MADSKTKADAKAEAKDLEKSAAVAAEKLKSAVADRVAAIEARWGKSIQEVMCDIHDHVFGATPPKDDSTEELAVEVGGEPAKKDDGGG